MFLCLSFVQKDVVLPSKDSPFSFRAVYSQYEASFFWRNPATKREFVYDRPYFEHFRVVESPVRKIVFVLLAVKDFCAIYCVHAFP